jgi:hypothetical protein
VGAADPPEDAGAAEDCCCCELLWACELLWGCELLGAREEACWPSAKAASDRAVSADAIILIFAWVAGRCFVVRLQ